MDQPEPEEVAALTGAADPSCDYDQMVSLYADAVRARQQGRSLDFAAIHKAVTVRWPRRLQYIKAGAAQVEP